MNKRFHPVAVVIVLTGMMLFCVSLALAAEVQLAGIRLNEPVINLITRKGWGLPEGIGPIASAASAGTASTRATSAAPTARPGTTASPQAGRPLSPAQAMAAGPTRGGTIASSRTQSPTTATASVKGELRGTGGLQYWLYSKSNGMRVVIGVEPSGNIATLNVQGPPNNQVRTSRGIGLGSSYFDLINFYGYPETSQPIATGLRVNYSDQDVTFMLQNLQVTEITVGKPPALPAATTATASSRNQDLSNGILRRRTVETRIKRD